MASLLLSNSLSSSSSSTFLRLHETKPPFLSSSSFFVGFSPSQQQELRLLQLKKSNRGRLLSSVVTTRAGGVSSSSYIFAIVFPLSLLAVTIFASARIADRLDQKFLEEVAVNQTIMEGEEDDGIVSIPLEGKPATPRTRNRPKREVEPSTK